MQELIITYQSGIIYAFLVFLILCINDSRKLWPGIEEFILSILTCVVLGLAWPLVVVGFVFSLVFEGIQNIHSGGKS